MNVRVFAAVVAAVAVVATIAAVAVAATWPDVDIGVPGLLAIAFGVFASFAVGGGLMFLLFLSARRDSDDPS